MDPAYAERVLLILSISSGHIKQVRQKIAWKNHSYCPVKLTSAKQWERLVFFSCIPYIKAKFAEIRVKYYEKENIFLNEHWDHNFLMKKE